MMSQREQYIYRTPKAGVCQPLGDSSPHPLFQTFSGQTLKLPEGCKQKVKHVVFWRSELLGFLFCFFWQTDDANLSTFLGCRWPLRLNFFSVGN